ncbi:MAG: deoxyribose-phosphate aldolase [Candidatus Lokiarchaeota archaeon]|nr:deoxyribose-phosphate aldolase [Candidatus Lokiarchaeota archaeon]
MEINNPQDLAKIIDHTNLKPDATEESIKLLCDEAIEYGFGAVCINPSYVESAKEYLGTHDVHICTVIGFPLGATLSEVKSLEAKKAIELGATEIDMVINIGALKSGDLEKVRKDIEAVIDASHPKIVKVILETCFLTDEEIVKACEIAKAASADFVKTSTGFGTAGATVDHVTLMRKTVGQQLGVKASGGIRSYKDAKEIIKAGANRIGASSGVNIIKQMKGESRP